MTDQRFRDAAYPPETGEAFVLLLEIRQEDLEEPIYLTDAAGAWNATLGTYTLEVGGISYLSAPMRVYPPGQSDEPGQGKITIPNVDMEIGAAVDRMGSKAQCTVTIVLESDPTVICGGPHRRLDLRNIQGEGLTVTGDLSRRALTDQPWPRQSIRPGKFRAAHRL